MHIKQARTLNVYWAPGEGIDLYALATTLQKLPPGAHAYSIEATQDSDDTSFNVLRIEYTIDETAEQRRIIEEHKSLDPMKAFADLTREMHKLPIRD
jgi:hypothetical protein